jgi:hypothetical protein
MPKRRENHCFHHKPAELLEQNPSNGAYTENVQGGFFSLKKPLQAGGFRYIYSDSAVSHSFQPVYLNSSETINSGQRHAFATEIFS